MVELVNVQRRCAQLASPWLAQGQFLAAWRLPDGTVAVGEPGTATEHRNAAKRRALYECDQNQQGLDQCEGYVVERRAGRLLVFEVAYWDARKRGYVPDAGCWIQMREFDVDRLWPKQESQPRRRTSPLA